MVNRAFVAALIIASFSSHGVMARESGHPFLTHGVVADAPTGFVEFCQRDQYNCMAGHVAPAQAGQGRDKQMVFAGFDLSVNTPSLLNMTVKPSAASLPALPSLAGLDRVQNAAHGKATARAYGPFVRLWASTASIKPSPAQRFGSGASVRTMEPAATVPIGLGSTPAVIPASASEGGIALIEWVNAQVNQRIVQVYDRQSAGVDEYWQRPNEAQIRYGDCEDIAIEKRMRLVEAGYPANALFFAVTYIRGYGLHTVLIARLAERDVVLDSMTPRILPWNKVRYTWVRLQSPEDPMVWTTIDRGGAGQPAQVIHTAAREQDVDEQS